MKFRDRLKAQYLEEIKDLHWDKLDWVPVEDEEGGFYESAYLGSILVLRPSGKFYMPWTTNQTSRDVFKDTLWHEAFEEVLNEKGYFQDSSEGCDTDVRVGRALQNPVVRRAYWGGTDIGWVEDVASARVYPKGYTEDKLREEYEEVPCDAQGNLPDTIDAQELRDWIATKVGAA